MKMKKDRTTKAVNLAEVNKRSRGWLMTIYVETDDPGRGKITHEQVEEAFRKIDPQSDWVFQMEEGEERHRLHYQLALLCSRNVNLTRKGITARLKANDIPDAWVEAMKREELAERYCSKLRTRVLGPWYSSARFKGQVLSLRGSKQGKRTDITEIREAIEGGSTVNDLLLSDALPTPALTTMAERLYQAVNERRWAHTERTVRVHYLTGPTGSGKSRYVYRTFDPEHVFTAHLGTRDPFDGYSFEPILFLDEFRSQLPISEMLMLLDRYPFRIDRRYHDSFAAWTEVFIASNWTLNEQYSRESSADRQAFFRRITETMSFPIKPVINHFYDRDLFTGKQIKEPGITRVYADGNDAIIEELNKDNEW